MTADRNSSPAEAEMVAAALWRAELVDAGVPQLIIGLRTPEAFQAETDSTRARWLKFARAALTAAPKATETPGQREAATYGFAHDPHDQTRDAALSATPQPVAVTDDLVSYYARQIEWSRETFGPALRTGGVLDHIRKELREIEADPHDLSEWVDVIILAMDGYWRHGGAADGLMPSLLAKQAKNMARTWPDWRTMSESVAIEHDRSGEPAVPADGAGRDELIELIDFDKRAAASALSAERAAHEQTQRELDAFKACHGIGRPQDGYRELVWRDAAAFYEDEHNLVSRDTHESEVARLRKALEEAKEDEQDRLFQAARYQARGYPSETAVLFFARHGGMFPVDRIAARAAARSSCEEGK